MYVCLCLFLSVSVRYFLGVWSALQFVEKSRVCVHPLSRPHFIGAFYGAMIVQLLVAQMRCRKCVRRDVKRHVKRDIEKDVEKDRFVHSVER